MSACTLTEPHDCVNVRAANSSLRRHLDRACEDRDAARRRVATLEARLARVLRYGWQDHGRGAEGVERGGVWSRKRTGGGR